MYKCFIFLLISASLLSCKSEHHYEKDVKFENKNWLKFNSLDFEIPVMEGETYQLTGVLTTDSNFKKRKIEIGVYLYLPNGEERLEDQSFRILDYEYNPIGTKIENSFQTKKILRNNLNIKETGILKLQIVLHSQYLDNFGIEGFEIMLLKQ